MGVLMQIHASVKGSRAADKEMGYYWAFVSDAASSFFSSWISCICGSSLRYCTSLRRLRWSTEIAERQVSR